MLRAASIIKRKRNINFQKAIDKTNESYLYWQDRERIINLICSYAEAYSEDTYDKIIVLEHKQEQRFKLIEYISRFSDKYITKVYQKFYNLNNKLTNYQKALFLTLTVDPKNFHSIKQEYKELQHAFNKLNSYLKKKYNLKQYIKVVEFTKSDIPHLHILYLHDDFIDIDKIRQLWQKYGIGIMVNIQLVQRRYVIENDKAYLNGVLSYILKYIVKSIGKDTNKELDPAKQGYRSLCIKWALQSRTFSISKAVSLILKGNKTNSNCIGQWVYCCSIPKQLLGTDLSYDAIRSIIMQFMGGG